MSREAEDRVRLEIRDWLQETRDREAVTRRLQERGFSEAAARELVASVYQANLRANRRSSISSLIGSGGLFAALLFVIQHAHRFRAGVLIALTLCGGGFLWSLAALLLANGYEVGPD